MKLGIDSAKVWFVVRSNIKCEAKAAFNLRRAGFDVYLPTQRIEKWNKRTNTYRQIERPLMLRYLFLGMPRDAKQQHWGFARACEGVEAILGDKGGSYIPIPHKFVEGLYLEEVDMQHDDTRAARIHRKEEAKTKKQTTEMRFPAGELVYVTDEASPWVSFNGLVEEVTKAGTVKALMNIFGRMTPVEFDPKQLKPAA
jgi:transcriptional antiterminator NusG